MECGFFAFQEGMLDTRISALGGWPTVSPRFLRVLTSDYLQRRYWSSVRNFSDVPRKPIMRSNPASPASSFEQICFAERLEDPVLESATVQPFCGLRTHDDGDFSSQVSQVGDGVPCCIELIPIRCECEFYCRFGSWSYH